MKLSHFSAIILSGLLWSAIGVMLFYKGVFFLVQATFYEVGFSGATNLILLPFLSISPAKSIMYLLILALSLGIAKGRIIFAKTVRKGVLRIVQLPNPVKLHQVYSLKYIIIIALMMGLGIAMKKLAISEEIRGVIDVAVGAALIQGAYLYFKAAYQLRFGNTAKKDA